MAKEKQIVRKAKKGKPIRQVAAVPFRFGDDGRVQVMLITSATTRRFIVPKGWPMKGRNGRQAAAQEAREEAGIEGKTLRKPLGGYSYWKRLSDCFVPVVVKVYLLKVTKTLPDWQESDERQRAWLLPADAARLIDEPDLASLVLSVSDMPVDAK